MKKDDIAVFPGENPHKRYYLVKRVNKNTLSTIKFEDGENEGHPMTINTKDVVNLGNIKERPNLLVEFELKPNASAL